MIDETKLISASSILPYDGKTYKVVFAPNHDTLKVGDRVRMVETPKKLENLLQTIDDNRLHLLERFALKNRRYLFSRREGS